MMAMTIARGSRKSGDDDLRPELPDDPHVVLQDIIVSPLRQRFRGGLREAEIEVRSKELLGMIEASCGQKLFSADHAERFKEFCAQEVLSAIAPRSRQISGAHALAAR